MMWMGKERQREKECPERESKTLKECNAGVREREGKDQFSHDHHCCSFHRDRPHFEVTESLFLALHWQWGGCQ